MVASLGHCVCCKGGDYSNKEGSDSEFVECIDRRLNKTGIIYWRDIHDAPAGPLERIVTNAIEQNPDWEHITQRRNSKNKLRCACLEAVHTKGNLYNMSKILNALRWITNLLDEEGIPYQVVGGLAARAYGALRPIIDIDFYIPESGLSKLLPRVEKYVTRHPQRYISDLFDVIFMALEFEGQEIELSIAEGAKIFNSKEKRWVSEKIDFNDSNYLEIEGVLVPVIPLDRLIRYKRILARAVDLQDIEEILRGG